MSSRTARCVDDLADARAGDKGDTSILAVIARSQEGFEVLERELTPARVAEHFRSQQQPERTLLPHLRAMVFRLPGLLGGGVTGHHGLDGHGKALSYHLLTMPLTSGPADPV